MCFVRQLGVKRLSKPDLYLSEQPTFSGNYAIIATELQISLLPFLTSHHFLFSFKKKTNKLERKYFTLIITFTVVFGNREKVLTSFANKFLATLMACGYLKGKKE